MIVVTSDQMSDFKAEMHQIQFRWARPQTRLGGAYSAPPDPLAGFKGPTSKGEQGWDGKGREGTRREGREGGFAPRF